MHLIDTFTGEAARKMALTPFPLGAGWKQRDVVARATKMEVHGSDINDGGQDFCLFRLFDKTGHQFAEMKKHGY